MIFDTLKAFGVNLKDAYFGPVGSPVREAVGQVAAGPSDLIESGRDILFGSQQVTGGFFGHLETVLSDPSGTAAGFGAAFEEEQDATIAAVQGLVGPRGFTVLTLALLAVIFYSIAKVFG